MDMAMKKRFLFALATVLSASICMAQEPRKSPGPLSPREELATFKLLKGFKAELVASEPDVIDPVAMCFDERGRMFVCEMIGYPNGGVATGKESRGRIRLLTDEDGDGVFEKSVVYADGLRFVTGVMPWRGGIIVTVAPDIVYLKDTKGDGKADEKRVLYTGFGLNNIQQIVNSPTYGLDNWVYCLVGSTGGEITCPDKPDMKPLSLRGRGVRFKPDIPGSIEPTSGGGQYGLAYDDFQHWFVNTNSQHLRQIVLPDHYLRRNPYMTVPAVSLDIPDHGAACKLFRISPFEAWRVERTTRRKEDPKYKNLPPNELVPGGFVTSSCSPIVYTAGLFGKEYYNNTFVCDPANNLIHRDILEVKGSVFSAKRADADCEFFASTDNWCRPVFLTVGPEGAIYVCDFYREAIETPLSLPDDIKAKMNLESRARGRIWRIVPEGFKAKALPVLNNASMPKLESLLQDANPWVRLTAQRLIIESGDKSALNAEAASSFVRNQQVGLIHVYWTLHELGNLEANYILRILKGNTNPRIREVALRLAEGLAYNREDLRKAMAQLADDPDSLVRLQAALSLGAVPANYTSGTLLGLLTRPDADAWLQTAVLSSALHAAPVMLEAVLHQKDPAPAIVTRLALMIGAHGKDHEIGDVLKLVGSSSNPALSTAMLDGLGQGMQNSTRPLGKLWDDPPISLRGSVEQALWAFRKATVAVKDEKSPLTLRLAALRLLTYAPSKLALESLGEMLSATQPLEIQTAAVRALSARNEPEIVSLLLASWNHAGPSLRTALMEAIFARPDRIAKLLDALESKKITPVSIESARIQFLKTHPNKALRERSIKLLAGLGDSDRKKIVDSYKDALDLKPDIAKGKMLFAKNCAVCHRLDNVGQEVGADLLAALRNKSREALLIDILDPSREVDTRFVNYRVTTLNGQTYTGILAVESPSSITLRRAEKAEDTILRSQIEEIKATAKSLMPEEFEKQLAKQDVADLIAYLVSTVK
jgi:putative membrane-bound dehydrogenase-like protein